MRLSLIGAQMGWGGADARARLAPEALRRQGLSRLLSLRAPLEAEPEWVMLQPMDEPALPVEARAELFSRQLEAACRRELSRGKLPVVLGGDRSCAAPALAAASRRASALGESFGALWIDALLRSRPPSDPGALPDERPLASLLGHAPSPGARLIEGTRLCVLGARSHHEGEEELLLSAGAKIIWADPTSPEGLARDFQEALRALSRSDALAVSLGLGVFESRDMPLARVDEPGGLRLHELIHAARASARRMREPFRLIEISDHNPALAPQFPAAEALCELICAFLGH